MAKEYCGPAEEDVDVNVRAQLFKLMEYHSEKENPLHPAVFVIIKHLTSVCYLCVISNAQNSINVAQAFVILIC